MTSLLLDAAMLFVRAWTHAYTWRLPDTLRAARRAEIESDLWEFRNDTPPHPLAAIHILCRLALGMPDDLQWRLAHASVAGKSVVMFLAIMVAIAALIFVDLARARRLPVPPAPTPMLSPAGSPMPVPSLGR
jgi:hypothetical protein